MFIKRRPEECVTVNDPSKAYGGYTLFAGPHNSTDVWLVNMKGQVVHRWEMSGPLGSDVRLLPNGNQVRVNKTGTEPSGFLGTVGGLMVEVNWEGEVVWKHENPSMHHDWRRLPNGNTLLSTHVKLPEAVAAKVKGGLADTEPEEGMWGQSLQEVSPTGEVIWEWKGYEHMDLDTDIACPVCPRHIWGYVNGIDVFPNGDIVASFRYENQLFIIDRRTGAIKWRWGAWELGHQHNPTVLENGNILVFDNGFHRRPPYDTRRTVAETLGSRVLEIDPGTGDIVWEYADENRPRFYSAVCSSAQRLPNGNTLICETTAGRIFEVTADKEIVWEFVSPFYEYSNLLGWTNYIFRAHRYGYDFPGLENKDLDPDRFQFVMREEGKVSVSSSKQEEGARLRMKMLGY
ncbi:aryl-sulfate sulfotransferase [Chloroflexota bacterium]